MAEHGSSRRSRSLHLVWFSVGVAVGAVALVLQLGSPGAHLSDILRVGEASPARALIASELGTLHYTQGQGHDGQYSYLVARDPLAQRGLANQADDGGYRFRRALYSWLAGGFGSLTPWGTLWGLAVWSILGLGIATAAIAEIARLLGARQWAVVGVVANLGLWLPVQLATADALAIGLALAGVALVLHDKTWLAALVFAAAVLTKDTYLAFPLAVSAWLLTTRRRRDAVAVLLPAVLLLLGWSSWLELQIGQGFSLKGNLSWPLVGLVESLPWQSTANGALAVMALLGFVVAAAGVGLARHPLLTWLTAPWMLTALLSSRLVWEGGNNAVRALAPLWALGFLSLALWAAQRRSTSRRNLPV
ncbi:MAG: hypothetical protein GWP04_10270 [Gammaproteobacteria bacterium]|nr:hypothetical protein [Gammaproteobacteria bacterium]